MLLTHGAYDAMGGLAGAVAERAERSIARFLPSGEPALRRLFLMLVRPGQGTPDTRRRASFGEADELTEQMVAVLADARLVVVGYDPVNGDRTVEIAHEALIQSWHRLRDWVTADREFLVWRQRLGASRWLSGPMSSRACKRAWTPRPQQGEPVAGWCSN
jgi:hypothetical protein